MRSFSQLLPHLLGQRLNSPQLIAYLQEASGPQAHSPLARLLSLSAVRGSV